MGVSHRYFFIVNFPFNNGFSLFNNTCVSRFIGLVNEVLLDNAIINELVRVLGMVVYVFVRRDNYMIKSLRHLIIFSNYEEYN